METMVKPITTPEEPACNDSVRRMDNQAFGAWANYIRAKVYRDIQRSMYVTGEFPLAIIAGGEYQYVFMCDGKETQRAVDGSILWRGVPIIRCGAYNKVSVVWSMEDISLPQPDGGEN